MVCPETTACPVLQDSMANPETRDRLVWTAPQEDPDLSDQKEMTDSLEHQAKTVCPVCLVLKERPVSQVFLDKMDCPVKREREAWMASQERLDRKVMKKNNVKKKKKKSSNKEKKKNRKIR